MKNNLILSLAIVFTLALLAPAVVSAFDSSPVAIVDNKEKKDEAKTTVTGQPETKAETATTETKACCEKAGKAGCDKAGKEGCCKGANMSEAKSCAGQMKSCAGQTKPCTSEKKACCSAPKTDK